MVVAIRANTQLANRTVLLKHNKIKLSRGKLFSHDSDKICEKFSYAKFVHENMTPNDYA